MCVQGCGRVMLTSCQIGRRQVLEGCSLPAIGGSGLEELRELPSLRFRDAAVVQLAFMYIGLYHFYRAMH